MSVKKLNVGDIFNETDEDEIWEVNEIRSQSNPPIVLCSKQTNDSESEETEQEYDVDYV